MSQAALRIGSRLRALPSVIEIRARAQEGRRDRRLEHEPREPRLDFPGIPREGIPDEIVLLRGTMSGS